MRKYLRDFHDDSNGRNLPVYTRKSPEQVERELIYRALLEVKSDIMELKEILRRRPVPQGGVAVGHHVEDARIDTATDTQTEPIITLDAMEKRSITEALERYKGNRRFVSRALNISERTLYRKIKEYGLSA